MILNPPVVVWICEKCPTTTRKPRRLDAQEFHNCPGMGGLSYPMIEEGSRVKVTVNEREDYIGKEDVQLDGNGRPVMNVIIEREDGTDCAVYAPVANTHGGALS